MQLVIHTSSNKECVSLTKAALQTKAVNTEAQAQTKSLTLNIIE